MNHTRLSKVTFAAAMAAALLLAKGAAAADFTVTTNADSGGGSLREAIGLANGAAGADRILFSIGSGAVTIAPLSALPAITGAA